MTYALALILPIVTTFFLAFGVLRGLGLFLRLSVIANRMFAMLGLNGRAGAADGAGPGLRDHGDAHHPHPAHRRERLITTFLMALAIPARPSSAWCSACSAA